MYITFPSWDFITAFNLDTWWWWFLSLHRTLLLALSSHKSSPVSGRFSPRSKKGKLSLISWIKFAVCHAKRQSVLQQAYKFMFRYPLYRKKVQLTELEQLFMRNVPGFGNSSSLPDFYMHHTTPGKSRAQNNSRLERTWKWQSTCSFNVYKVFFCTTCNIRYSWHELTLMENQQI